jgi:eukaryotic-like serine/threonine-protein kinase
MATAFSWTLIEDGAPKVFALKGSITESADFANLLAQMGDKNRFDASGIEQINSTGVREWILFIRNAEAAGKTLELTKCAVTFVTQLNMIKGFVGAAKIDSVMAPFTCPDCEASSTLEVRLDKPPVEQVEPGMPCKECGATMVFDDLLEHYFAFAAGPKKA